VVKCFLRYHFKLIRLQKMMYVLACVGALCVVVLCYGTYSTVHGAKGVEYRLSVCTCTVYTLLVFSLLNQMAGRAWTNSNKQ
jgi:hypothetical protein